jgi:hypothetical protein
MLDNSKVSITGYYYKKAHAAVIVWCCLVENHLATISLGQMLDNSKMSIQRYCVQATYSDQVLKLENVLVIVLF